MVSLLQKLVIKQQKLILKLQLNSTHSLMRKDLTGHTGPLTYAHNKTKQNKHAKFMVTLPHGRQQHYLAVF